MQKYTAHEVYCILKKYEKQLQHMLGINKVVYATVDNNGQWVYTDGSLMLKELNYEIK